jgi:hypothetical protein
MVSEKVCLDTLRALRLEDKGRRAADAGGFPATEKALFYHADPYAVFIAQQFRPEHEEFVRYLREEVLVPNGFTPARATPRAWSSSGPRS